MSLRMFAADNDRADNDAARRRATMTTFDVSVDDELLVEEGEALEYLLAVASDDVVGQRAVLAQLVLH